MPMGLGLKMHTGSGVIPKFVQMGQNYVNSVASNSVTLKNVTPGNSLIVGISSAYTSTYTCSITDNFSTAYSAAFPLYQASVNQYTTAVWVCSAYGGNTTVTVSWTGAINYFNLLVHEVSGLSNAVDTYNIGDSTINGVASAITQIATVTTKTANDYLFNLCSIADENLQSVDSSFTLRSNISSASLLSGTADRIATTTGSYTTTWTESTNGNMLVSLVAFKPKGS